MNRKVSGAAVAVAAVLAAGAAGAGSASARAIDAPARAAKASCMDRPVRDRLQAEGNAAGVIFKRRGDIWHLWDNQRDEWVVTVEFNYAGVADAWKPAARLADGGQGAVHRNVSERYRWLCFRLYSPRFGTTRSVRSRT